jgi:hypothetical protein
VCCEVGTDQCYLSDQMEKNEMGWACSMYGGKA